MTEVKIIFTPDLKPYVEGLKAMLTMTATTGQQLKPLLNVSVKAPDLRGLESQLSAIVAKNDAYLKSLKESSEAADQLGASEGRHAGKADESTKAVARKSASLQHMKRSALDSFGAISFLAMGVVELSSQASGGSKGLDKLSQGMSQGISAGFGLAGTMATLGIATGGVAVAIGAAIAVGLVLLKYFDDSEERAKRNAAAMQMFSESLRGASRTDLEAYRAALIQSITESQRHVQALEAQKNALGIADLAGRAAILKQINIEEARAAGLVEQRQRIDEELSSREKTTAEVRDFIRQAETAATIDQFDQRRKAALETYQKEQRDYAGHTDALNAARLKYRSELKRIGDEEAQTDQQLSDTRFQAELSRIKAHALERGQIQERIDLTILEAQEVRIRSQLQRLAAISGPLTAQQVQAQAQLEVQLSQNLEQQTQSRIALRNREKQALERTADLEFDQVLSRLRTRGLQEGRLQEEIDLAVILRQHMRAASELALLQQKEEAGTALDEKERTRKLELETDLTRLTESGTRARLALVQAERERIAEQYQLLIGPIQAAFDSLYQSIFERQRATSQWMIDQRNNDYELYLIDLEKRKEALKAQLYAGEIDSREYMLRLDQLRLDQRAKEEEHLEFQRQLDQERKTSAQKAYEALRGTVVSILGDIVREEIKQGLVSVIQHAKHVALKIAETAAGATADTTTFTASETAKTTALAAATAARLAISTAALATMTAATVASMSAIAAAAAPAATLVSIATAGGAAVSGGAAVLTAMGTIQAASLIKLADGGLVSRPTIALVGEAGDEVWAPKKDFIQVFRETLLPEILLPRIRPDVLSSIGAYQRAGEIGQRGPSGGTTEVHFHLTVENYYGDQEHFDRVIKPGVEEAMRRLGAASVDQVFVNTSRREMRGDA